jgi:uroporphyrinogen-III synthase
MVTPQPLKGLRIVVTRPAHQAGHLCALIRAAGGVPLELPVLAVEDPQDLEPALAVVQRIHDFNIAVFVSTNAVAKGLALIHRGGDVPARLQVAAVGRRTAEALLRQCGRLDIQAPPPYNSEALLATAELQDVTGKRIVIFRGVGGRELLAETLRRRGAQVDYAEVYRRVRPAAVRLSDIIPTAGNIDLIMITSQDGLQNLVEMAEMEQRREWLMDLQLVVISPRVAQLAAELGFKRPALTAGHASDEAMVTACRSYSKT